MNKYHQLGWLSGGLIAAAMLVVSCNGLLSSSGHAGPLPPPAPGPDQTLATSLHGTSGGMQWWYTQPNGAGSYFGVAFTDTGCITCHTATCDQCHATPAAPLPVDQPAKCMSCHGWIALEAQLQVTDVHTAAGMVCGDCHSSKNIHGDGTQYSSMSDAAALAPKCTNCHAKSSSAAAVPDTTPHTVHGGKVACDACHVSTVITCYNCHFETMLSSHEKLSAADFKDFIILMNDADGIVRAGTYQSVVYQDKTFVSFGPYHGHAVTAQGRGCADCHANQRIQELNDTGKIVMTRWDAAGGQVTHTTGVVPFVPDKFEFQYVTLDGADWVPLSTTTGRTQYEFCSPLTADQLASLSIVPPTSQLPTSLHGTARGMQWWYERPTGAGQLFGVNYADAGCGTCHVNSCGQCHANANGSGGVQQPTACAACHSQFVEGGDLDLNDVHTAAGMNCSDCHTAREMHGDGNAYDSFLSPGAMDVKCVNCHTSLPDNPEHSQHGASFDCDVCHVESVTTCYNCHFETLLTDHEKKTAAEFKDFIILMNGDDGKLRAGTYQSMVYQDQTFVSFGPYHSHSVTAAGRTCTDCHASARMLELRDTGKIVMTQWDAGAKKATHTTGVIPFVPDKLEFQFLTLNNGEWEPLTTTTSQVQYEFCTPLADSQVKALTLLPPNQTLPGSLMSTAAGKEFWYNQPNGLGSLISSTYAESGCGKCHVDTSGPDGGCTTCHSPTDNSVDQPGVCAICHGGPDAEFNLGLPDVHTDAGMRCSDCHLQDIHGDGTTYHSMWDAGAIDAKCENCHPTIGKPGDTVVSHTVHNGKLNCDACHVSTVVTCYNCHFESWQTNNEERSYGALKDFILLVNDDNGQVRAGTYQAVVAEGKTFVAFGPFHGHSITAQGRACADCHGSARMTELNDTGAIVMTRWDDTLSPPALVHAQGVIPLVPGAFQWQFLNYDAGTQTWSPSTTVLDQYQLEFCSPLTTEQLQVLSEAP